MKAIIRIGGTQFLVDDVGKASTVLKILGSALQVDMKYVRTSKQYAYLYFPRREERELGLSMINEDQLRAIEPETNEDHEETSVPKPLVVVKVLPRRRRLLLGSGQ